MEHMEATPEGGGGADGAKKCAAGECRAGEARDGGEAQEDFAEDVITERGYGGGSGCRRLQRGRVPAAAAGAGFGHSCEDEWGVVQSAPLPIAPRPNPKGQNGPQNGSCWPNGP